MSRPRTPYGNPPGRLPATMIKVLAAELSDQGRLARGKRYWADHAVIDIVVGHGAVTAEIQGSRAQPYIVTIEAVPGIGAPSKRDVWIRCTCPDDTGTGSEACKHAVAALFALSDEVAIEPDLIERWRGGSRSPRAASEPESSVPLSGEPSPRTDRPGGSSAASATAWPSNVVPLHRDRPTPDRPVVDRPPARDDDADEIAALLAPPGGGGPPTFPEVGLLEHRITSDRLLGDVLADALDHLLIDLD